MDQTYESCTRHGINIVLDDFNAKVEKEGIFGLAVRICRLHDVSCNNELRLIDFTAARNMGVGSTKSQHFNIHQASWLPPDQNTRNQIDHVLIDGRHASSILDVWTMRGANIDFATLL